MTQKDIQNSDIDEEESQGHKTPLWLIIYTDMITNLMIFFLMSYCLTWLNEKDRQVAAASFQEVFGGKKGVVQQTLKDVEAQKLIDEEKQKNMEEKIKEQFSNVEINEERIKITLPSPVLFDSGKADLKPGTLKTLHEVSDIIRNIPNRVIVEGHTDNIPIHSPQFKSNWDLSAARAFSVIKYFIEKEKIEPKRLSAFGYGEYRPKVPNDTPENRKENRRIEISIIKVK